jgi:hypothetical protein
LTDEAVKFVKNTLALLYLRQVLILSLNRKAWLLSQAFYPPLADKYGWRDGIRDIMQINIDNVRAQLRRTSTIIPILLLSICLIGCSNDPYEPFIGGRNARPGAERYLSSRNDISADQKEALLNSRPCSLDILRQLADSPSREVRSLVVANPSVDTTIQEKLLRDKEPGVRGYIATNPHTPHSILVKLKDDPDGNVQWMLPGNPNWSADEIRSMYMAEMVAVKRDKITSPCVFARNPSTPSDILEELSKSNDYNVRIALANNHAIPDSVVRTLARNGDSSVKIMLIYNRATSEDVLRSLSQDSDPKVRSYAVKFLSMKIQRKSSIEK